MLTSPWHNTTTVNQRTPSKTTERVLSDISNTINTYNFELTAHRQHTVTDAG